MTNFELSPDRVIAKAAADTDCTLLTLGGGLIAFVDDGGDEECIGYFQAVKPGQYVYNAHSGFSFGLDEHGGAYSLHGYPEGGEELHINDGNQEIAYRNGPLAVLLLG